jgi:hypothetical protein
MKRVMMAGLAVGALLSAAATVCTAEAFPAGKVQAPAAGSMVIDVGRGGYGGGPGGGHGGGPGGGHGGGYGHGPGHGWGGGGGGHHGHAHGGLRFYGAPFVGYGAYYYGGGGYSEGCGWLRRRAEVTGSGYWWARYEDCVDDNY